MKFDKTESLLSRVLRFVGYYSRDFVFGFIVLVFFVFIGWYVYQIIKDDNIESSVYNRCTTGDIACSYYYKTGSINEFGLSKLYGIIGKDTTLLYMPMDIESAKIKVEEFRSSSKFIKIP